MRLTNVVVESGTINLHDRDVEAGRNLVELNHVTFTGSPGAGLLVELNDRDDEVVVRDSTLSYPAGIAVRVSGTRDDTNEGGTIRVAGTTLQASDPAGRGVALAASEHSGIVELSGTVAETVAPVAVTAATCTVTSDAGSVSCASGDAVDDLAEQLRQAQEESAAD